MKNIMLQQNTNSFILKDNRWRHTQTRLEYVSQKIKHTISIFRGEWFMNREIGIPYIPDSGTERSMHRRMIETALQVRISEVEGVQKILSFTSTLDKERRLLTVRFTVQTDSGDTYTDKVEIGG